MASSGTDGRNLVLPDGRYLGYDEHGSLDGRPIFYFHGVPSSRLDFHMFGSDALGQRLGVRIVAVDRPGCGLSTMQRGRRIGDWPADVTALADHLGLERFAVLGWSGGGPYALACARLIPGRVTAAVVVSSLGPPDVPGLLDGVNRQSLRFFALNRDRPVVGRMLDRFMAFGVRRDPDKFVAKTVAALPPADGDVMRRPAVARAYVEAVLECFRSGPRGAQLDTALVLREWGFDPSAIAVPVRLWHGERDTDVAPVIGRWLAEAIPGCRAEFLPDEGHISLIVNRAEAILAGP